MNIVPKSSESAFVCSGGRDSLNSSWLKEKHLADMYGLPSSENYENANVYLTYDGLQRFVRFVWMIVLSSPERKRGV